MLDYEPMGARLSSRSADAVLVAVRDQGLDLRYVLETHAHADHLSAADYIRRRQTDAVVVIGAHITEVQKIFIPRLEAYNVTPDGAAFDRLVNEGDRLDLGRLRIEVLHTPGHTPACVTYKIGDAAFVGGHLVSEAEFVARRRARDAALPPPVLLLPALQANIRAGALPPPTAEGHIFLRLPATWA